MEVLYISTGASRLLSEAACQVRKCSTLGPQMKCCSCYFGSRKSVAPGFPISSLAALMLLRLIPPLVRACWARTAPEGDNKWTEGESERAGRDSSTLATSLGRGQAGVIATFLDTHSGLTDDVSWTGTSLRTTALSSTVLWPLWGICFLPSDWMARWREEILPRGKMRFPRLTHLVGWLCILQIYA